MPISSLDCSICGANIEPFLGDYPSPVCRDCQDRSVNSNHKLPYYDSMAEDGDNPVFIDGIKCWRRYSFGGYVTMRDSDDCATYEEFYERHFPVPVDDTRREEELPGNAALGRDDNGDEQLGVGIDRRNRMTEPASKAFSFGSCDLVQTSPEVSALSPNTQGLNLRISFEEALKLHLAIGECIRKLNSYKRSTSAGKRTALTCIIHEGNRSDRWHRDFASKMLVAA